MAFDKEESNSKKTQQKSCIGVSNDRNEEEVLFLAEVGKIMESLRLEGDIGDEELLDRRDEIEIDEDIYHFPKKLMPVVKGAENQCHFLKIWGHD